MKIKSLKLKNFRSYKDEIEVKFDDLTVFVGKNDIGKSTILEALDIFFNDGKGVIKFDKTDINREAIEIGEKEAIISVIFSDLPEKIVIDSTNQTNLKDEYLLNAQNELEIIKKYSTATTNNTKVYIKTLHPTNPQCCDLLSKKNNELRKIIKDNSIECTDNTRNSIMRKAIWKFYEETLDLQLVEFEVSKLKEEGKSILSKIESEFPLYTLFQADRKNCDEDSEVQDPLKEAVKEILKNEELQKELEGIADKVREKLIDVSERTLEKLKEMSPEIASTLQPIIPDTNSLKWTDVFKKVSICGDENIPINKRGSGVKRLILLNFFRAEAERRLQEKNIPKIIYAIEEPETSQHTENQKKLIDAFIKLSENQNTQVILTTHSPNIVKKLDFSNLRLIKVEEKNKSVCEVIKEQLPYPSLNEVNFSAFSEVTEEYHNELYGYIEENSWLNEYKLGKTTREYIREMKKGNKIELKTEHKILTEYIRHQIHYPENKNNILYTTEELQESISLMREFIEQKNS